MDVGRSMRAVKDGLSASSVEVEESEGHRWTCAVKDRLAILRGVDNEE